MNQNDQQYNNNIVQQASDMNINDENQNFTMMPTRNPQSSVFKKEMNPSRMSTVQKTNQKDSNVTSSQNPKAA